MYLKAGLTFPSPCLNAAVVRSRVNLLWPSLTSENSTMPKTEFARLSLLAKIRIVGLREAGKERLDIKKIVKKKMAGRRHFKLWMLSCSASSATLNGTGVKTERLVGDLVI